MYLTGDFARRGRSHVTAHIFNKGDQILDPPSKVAILVLVLERPSEVETKHLVQ